MVMLVYSAEPQVFRRPGFDRLSVPKPEPPSPFSGQIGKVFFAQIISFVIAVRCFAQMIAACSLLRCLQSAYHLKLKVTFTHLFPERMISSKIRLKMEICSPGAKPPSTLKL
jgi:hypothetical protein